jgi:hypothetical protein
MIGSCMCMLQSIAQIWLINMVEQYRFTSLLICSKLAIMIFWGMALVSKII